MAQEMMTSVCGFSGQSSVVSTIKEVFQELRVLSRYMVPDEAAENDRDCDTCSSHSWHLQMQNPRMD
jgi:hypothetical protein